MRAPTTNRFWTLALLGLFGAAAGCTSRTVPLPPPIVESLSLPNEDGLVRVRGLAHEGASIGVMNEATQEGVVVTSHETGCDSSCAFEAHIAAEVGDTIRVWQFFETESSRHVEVPTGD
jgi:hypothetical protein